MAETGTPHRRGSPRVAELSTDADDMTPLVKREVARQQPAVEEPTQATISCHASPETTGQYLRADRDLERYAMLPIIPKVVPASDGSPTRKVTKYQRPRVDEAIDEATEAVKMSDDMAKAGVHARKLSRKAPLTSKYGKISISACEDASLTTTGAEIKQAEYVRVPHRHDFSRVSTTITNKPPRAVAPSAVKQVSTHARPKRANLSSTDSASKDQIIDSLMERLEKSHAQVIELEGKIQADATKQPQKSRASYALSSLRRVMHKSNTKSSTTTMSRPVSISTTNPIHTGPNHRRSSGTLSNASRRPSRIPRPMLSPVPSFPKSPARLEAAMQSPSRRSSQFHSAQVLYIESRKHEKYAKSWSIAAEQASKRAAEHSQLATSALRAFGTLLSDLMGDEEMVRKAKGIEEISEKKITETETAGKEKN